MPRSTITSVGAPSTSSGSGVTIADASSSRKWKRPDYTEPGSQKLVQIKTKETKSVST